MISCVITTLKVNEYQRKNDLFRINFIISCQLIKKSDHASARVGPTECILLDSMTISWYIRNESAWYLTFQQLKMHKSVFNTHCGSNFLCHAIV